MKLIAQQLSPKKIFGQYLSRVPRITADRQQISLEAESPPLIWLSAISIQHLALTKASD
jgi:hypothetical protein